jgi:hypothetical protein
MPKDYLPTSWRGASALLLEIEACVWIKMEDRVATFYYKKYYEKVFANTPTNN